MTCFEFADLYRALAPNTGYYVSHGHTKEFELSMIGLYDCKYLGKRIEKGDELLNLIVNFDLSKVRLGLIAFYDSVLEFGDYYVLGTDESDPIWMNKFSHEIEVRDFVDNSYTIYKLAANGACFLEAIYYARQFFLQYARNPQFEIDPSMREQKARECANMAGGDDYLLFYQTVLQVETSD